jgi:hypothetical protein
MYSTSSLDRDSILTDKLFGFMYDPSEFIAKSVIPVLNVPNDGLASEPPRTFKLVTLNDAPYRIPDGKTRPKGRVTMIDIDHSTDLFEVEDIYLEASVEKIENGQFTGNLEEEKTKFIADNLDVIHEKDVSAVLFAAANYAVGWKTDLSAGGGALQWNNSAAVPLTDIKKGIRKCRKPPDYIVFGLQAWDAFCLSDQVLKAFGIEGGAAGRMAASITTQAVADYFKINESVDLKVYVGAAKYDSSAEGQTEVEAYVWGPHVAIGRSSGATSEGNAKRTFCHTVCYSQMPSEVFKWFTMDGGPRGSLHVRGGWNRSLIVKSNKGGYFIENAVPTTY